MEHDPGIFDERNLEAEDASIARARADIVAGRFYSNDEVVAWLRTWGTPDFKPFPHKWPR